MTAFCDHYHCTYNGITVSRHPESETVIFCDRYSVTTDKRKYDVAFVVQNFVCAECSGKLEAHDKLENFVVTETQPYCVYCDSVATQIKHVSRVYWEDMQDIEQFKSLPDAMKDRVYPDWHKDSDFAPESDIELDVNLLWR